MPMIGLTPAPWPSCRTRRRRTRCRGRSSRWRACPARRCARRARPVSPHRRAWSTRCARGGGRRSPGNLSPSSRGAPSGLSCGHAASATAGGMASILGEGRQPTRTVPPMVAGHTDSPTVRSSAGRSRPTNRPQATSPRPSPQATPATRAAPGHRTLRSTCVTDTLERLRRSRPRRPLAARRRSARPGGAWSETSTGTSATTNGSTSSVPWRTSRTPSQRRRPGSLPTSTTRSDAEQEAAGVPEALRGAGVGAQVALARRESPHRGGRHLGLAQGTRARDAPHPARHGARGDLGVAGDPDPPRDGLPRARSSDRDRRRARAPTRLVLEGSATRGWSPRSAGGPTSSTRTRSSTAISTAENERRVTIRPAPDTMCYLTALLPVAQGVATYAALTAPRTALALPATSVARDRSWPTRWSNE